MAGGPDPDLIASPAGDDRTQSSPLLLCATQGHPLPSLHPFWRLDPAAIKILSGGFFLTSTHIYKDNYRCLFKVGI